MLRCVDVEVTSGTLWMLRCVDVEVTSGTLWMLRCVDVEVTQQIGVGLAVETPQTWTWLGFTVLIWETHENDQQKDRILEVSRPQM